MTDDELTTSDEPYFVRRLKLEADPDERAIKRAYARELKLIDQETNAAGFQDLREAYDAALYWLRHGPAMHWDEEFVDQFEEIDRAAKELQLQPASAGIGNSADAGASLAVHLDLDADAVAQDVFTEFEARCSVLHDLHVSQSWERELQASLADVRLIHIGARQAFEQRVADLLAGGWRPGHDLLFVVAAKVFAWADDRRRVHALGMAGYTLHFALEQRALYDMQSDDACALQRQLIMRLRDAPQPSTNELIDLMPVLATVEARFPTWLSLIADTDNISRWHHLDQSVSTWRRRLRRRDFDVPVWPFVIVFLLLMRVLFNYSESRTDEPTPQMIAAQHVVLGRSFLDNDDNAKAVASFDKALSVDPANADAYGGRAMSLVFLSEKARALADLEKLESLQPRSPLLFRTRGLLARREGRQQDAVAAYTRSLEIDPSNTWTLVQRGYAYRDVGELDKALRDADRLLQIEPGWPKAHSLRARVFMDRKDTAGARAEIAAMLLAADKYGDAYAIASLLLQQLGDRQGALAVMQKAVAASPSASHYLEMSNLRPIDDIAARRADIEAALGMEPNSSVGLTLRISLELQAKQWDAVIHAANRAMEMASMNGKKPFLMTSRGIAHAKRANMQKANQDFESARVASSSPSDLNSLCYQMAVYNVALQTALASCNASLEQDPKSWHTLDSKAFTLLRMKRYREALAAYDVAVRDAPGTTNAVPLYGRGVVNNRLGNKIAGQADIKAALAIDPAIGQRFARMELVP